MSGGRRAKASLVNNQKLEGFPSGCAKTAQQGLLGVDVLLMSSSHSWVPSFQRYQTGSEKLVQLSQCLSV